MGLIPGGGTNFTHAAWAAKNKWKRTAFYKDVTGGVWLCASESWNGSITELFKDNTLLLEFILEMCVCGGEDLATHIGEFFYLACLNLNILKGNTWCKGTALLLKVWRLYLYKWFLPGISQLMYKTREALIYKRFLQPTLGPWWKKALVF